MWAGRRCGRVVLWVRHGLQQVATGPDVAQRVGLAPGKGGDHRLEDGQVVAVGHEPGTRAADVRGRHPARSFGGAVDGVAGEVRLLVSREKRADALARVREGPHDERGREQNAGGADATQVRRALDLLDAGRRVTRLGTRPVASALVPSTRILCSASGTCTRSPFCRSAAGSSEPRVTAARDETRARGLSRPTM